MPQRNGAGADSERSHAMVNDQFITSQLNFIGKVLCVFSHDINNQLAVVKESIGLIGDLIESGKTSRKDLQNISEIIGSIENQIKRTAYFCGNLAGFGHGMGETSSAFSVNKSVEELIVLLNRLASQKRITLEKDLKADLPLIEGNQLKLQFLIFAFIEKNLLRLEKNSRIVIKTSHSNGTVGISIIPKGNFVKTEEQGICGDEVFHSLAGHSGVSVSPEDPDGAVTVTLPVSPPSGDAGR
jgi:C4-dicarboxylate-specific signal transduction histidine kinase